MSTVVLTSSSVQSIGYSGIIPAGSLAWSDPNNAKVEDGLSAFVSFDGITTTSEFLYFNTFGASLPTENLSIDGFEVKVIREGVGDTEDYYVGLMYDSDDGTGVTWTVTSPGKQKAGAWSADVDSTAVYGGPTNKWNRVWTAAEVNNVNFGFAISCESPTISDSGSIDYAQITLSYHVEYAETTSGGTNGGGTADVQMAFAPVITGGATASGHGAMTEDIAASGGATVGGNADESESILVLGGATIGGSSVHGIVHWMPDWSVRLEGEQNAPPILDSTAQGEAEIGLRDDGAATSIIWRVNYSNMTSLDLNATKAHLKSAQPGIDGPVEVNLRFYSTGDGTAGEIYSPIIGHFEGLNATKVFQIERESGWYVSLNSETYPLGELRGQIWPYGSAGSGEAADQHTMNLSMFSFGQPYAGGTAEFSASYSPVGGSLAGGSAEVGYTSNLSVTGGATVSGFGIPDPYHPTGGVAWGGSAPIYLIKTNEGSGGATIGGTALMQHIIPVGGGATVGGEAFNIRSFPEIATGGATVSGDSFVDPYVGTGGAKLGGDSFVDPYIATGGATGGGTARVTQYYDTALQDNEYTIVARGENAVPPNATTETAFARIFMDVNTNVIHWDIWHQMGGDLDAVRLRGPADVGQTAGTKVAIDFMQPVNVSPIIGSTTLTAAQTSEVLAGQWYLYMRDDQGGDVMRAQIVPSGTGVVLGGLVPQLYFEPVSGGADIGGAADVDVIYNHIASGGTKLKPTFAIVSFSVFISGGSTVGGSAVVTSIFNPVASGGVTLGGEILEDAIFNPIISGGALGGGPKGIIGIAPKIGGGALAGGTPDLLFTYNLGTSGGCLVNGTARVTFFDQYISIAGVRVGGKVAGGYIKFYVQNVPNQRALARRSENILNAAAEDPNKLIPPTNDISPLLPDGRFRHQHNPGWCDVDEACKEGALAEIIVRRQKGYVPPKIRKNTRRDRRIATLN